MPKCGLSLNCIFPYNDSVLIGENEGQKNPYFGIFYVVNAWKVSKHGVFSGPYFPVFSPKTGKYVPEKTPYLDTFHTVKESWN